MRCLIARILLFLGALTILSAPPALAQAGGPFVGRCDDDVRRTSYDVYPDLSLRDRNSGVTLPTARDPSGQMFLRMPAANPQYEAVFLDWQGALIKITPVGTFQIGRCFIALPPPPIVTFVSPPLQPGWGVLSPTGQPFLLPQQFAQQDVPFMAPMLASSEQAEGCFYKATGDRVKFAECMIDEMAGDREKRVYDCGKLPDQAAASLCVVGVIGGEKEAAIAQSLSRCYEQYGQTWSAYPLCMSDQAAPNNDAIRLLGCIQQQYLRGGQATPLGTAICYGVGALDLNPEMQIAVQCAVASNGQPYAFVGCAGGQLTARELDKCFTNGVGGDDGCFGKNNTLIKGLNAFTQQINETFGPNSVAARGWANYVSVATLNPGKKSAPVVAVQNVGREINRAGGNIAKEAKKILPRFKL